MRWLLPIVIVLLAFSSRPCRATHMRAGEITYKQLGTYYYEVTITVFTKPSSNIDRPVLELHWGDGTKDSIDRINIQTLQGVVDVDKITYRGTHQYPGPATYILHFEDQNRNANVINMNNSANVAFFVQSMLVINPFLGGNNSVQLLNDPIDMGAINQLFIHNAGAYDPDGDSLSYQLEICKANGGVNCPGYSYPTASISFSIDAITGDLIWNTPVTVGIYNVAFSINEWRNGTKIGYVTRDMQIEILPSTNNPPVLNFMADTCVEAGSTCTFQVTATDADNDNVTLSATGAPFLLSPDSAYFAIQTSQGSVSSQFIWNTTCAHVRKKPWTVSFKAVDYHISPQPPSPLNFADYQLRNITIVAPAPQNLMALPQGNTINLTWDQSLCAQAKGYSIYRHIGATGWTHAYCETGVPSYTGYVNIKTIQNVTTTSFTDDNNGAGLSQGIDYCYLIIAWFDDGAESYASNEACAHLRNDIPLMTHVSVNTTQSTAGQIYIAWSKPNEIDSVVAPGPYYYILNKGTGQSGNSMLPYDTLPTINDTTYIDLVNNTVGLAYSYSITMINNTPNMQFAMGTCHFASSVYLAAQPTDKSVKLTWTEQVPWTNFAYIVYKWNGVSFDSIATTSKQNFTDTGLVNGQQHCYKIKSWGTYNIKSMPDTLYNYSQELCAIPVDNIAPCPPVIAVKQLCDSASNSISWSWKDSVCHSDLNLLQLYFIPLGSSASQLIYQTHTTSDTLYVHDSLPVIGGCYFITVTDSNGNSANSNTVCVDNCPKFDLPNVFTPNNDGINDFFEPSVYSYVDKTEFTIYNRWGNPVYRTMDKKIYWDGNHLNSGDPCPEGVYYYLCTFTYSLLDRKETKTITGVVHLIR
ncbi:MAG: gliding motility-associated C-terminal domain-containing protein [Bacteroidetes bacterium]|nr:gliding motility-associated C-terminal domain-containing protein [Bacteroidota bacterium]